MKFFLEDFKPYFCLSTYQSKILMYILVETYDDNLLNTMSESDLLYYNTWYVVTREYEFIPIWLDRMPIRRVMIYYFIRLYYMLYGTTNTSSSLVLDESYIIPIDSSTIESSLYVNLSDKLFFLSSFILLFLSIMFSLISGRTSYMKFLFALELLILVCILGFTLYQSGVCYLAGQINLALCLIAVAACESVLGLALFIIRRRITYTKLQDKFLCYFTFKNSINK